MQQKESRFKKKVQDDLKALQSLGAKIWYQKIQQVCIRGTPDILACINGKFVALELKRGEDGVTDALQKHKINNINLSGGLAFVVDPSNWPRVLKTIKKLTGV